MRVLLLYVLLTVNAAGVYAQTKYWVLFADKPGATNVYALSERALQRRTRQCIKADETDRPVYQSYLSSLAQNVSHINQVSRWLNGASCLMTAEQAACVSRLPFVRQVFPAGKALRNPRCDVKAYPVLSFIDTIQNSYNQLSMIGLHAMHSAGLNGQGMLVTVLDGGFTNVDRMGVFRHLRDSGRIVAVRNFVKPSLDPFRMGGEGEHGTRVLSILAGYKPPDFYGSAFGASFILGVTEDSEAEGHAEEDNWLAAMEWADSIGTDIISTSLGYFTHFTTDSPYTYADMDGRTTIISRAANLAAAKGILPVNAAGNEGDNPWHYIIAPADADSVLAVGGVDPFRRIVAFSSRGPTADGRVKPNVCARAWATTQAGSDNRIIWGYGTSFSCPLISGLAACLWACDSTLTNMQLFRQIESSADHHHKPDNDYGHGIPDAVKAYRQITGRELTMPVTQPGHWLIYPNPARNDLRFSYDNVNGYTQASIVIRDLHGRFQHEVLFQLQARYQTIDTDLRPLNLPSGMYLLELMHEGVLLGRQKFLIENP
jgi:subtilisin family serine protease